MNAQDTTTRTDDQIIALWRYIDETGNIVAHPLTAAEYDRLAVLLPAERAAVLDCKSLDYPVCRTCGNERVVTHERIIGSWASWDGPQVDYVETPCGDCQDEAGDWEPLVYDDDALDAYLDGLYAQTRRDERAEVAA